MRHYTSMRLKGRKIARGEKMEVHKKRWKVRPSTQFTLEKEDWFQFFWTSSFGNFTNLLSQIDVQYWKDDLLKLHNKLQIYVLNLCSQFLCGLNHKNFLATVVEYFYWLGYLSSCEFSFILLNGFILVYFITM